MKNIAHKFATEKGFVSTKIQYLMDEEIFPDEEFEYPVLKDLYYQSKQYHKSQRGVIRISKYTFSENADIKRKCLKKNNLLPETVSYFYDDGLLSEKKESSETEGTKKKIWYVNASAEEVFQAWGSDSRSQEASMIREMPLLRKASLFLESNIQPSICFQNQNELWMPSPILFEGVPLWLSNLDGKTKFITWDQKINIVSMMAPYGGEGAYTIGQLLNLFLTLFSAFGGIIKRGKKDKADYTELHTNSWGCGNFRNNIELIYLAQLYVADVLGIDRIIFHSIDIRLMDSAIKKYHEIPDNISFSKALNHFFRLGFKWQ